MFKRNLNRFQRIHILYISCKARRGKTWKILLLIYIPTSWNSANNRLNSVAGRNWSIFEIYRRYMHTAMRSIHDQHLIFLPNILYNAVFHSIFIQNINHEQQDEKGVVSCQWKEDKNKLSSVVKPTVRKQLIYIISF